MIQRGIHITDRKQQPYFEKALRQLDAWKVDAVLACGDLADYGLKQQLELLAETWFKVFPDGKGSGCACVGGRKLIYYAPFFVWQFKEET